MITKTIRFAGALWDIEHDGLVAHTITLHDSTFDLYPYLSGATVRKISALAPALEFVSFWSGGKTRTMKKGTYKEEVR